MNYDPFTALKKLAELEGEEYTLIQSEQDLAALLAHIGEEKASQPKLFPEDTITAAIVKLLDGEYAEVWLTTYPAYYNLSSLYEQVL